MDAIETRIANAISSVLGHKDFVFSPDLTAVQVDGWDSLSHLLIITSIEKEFGIRFKLKELNSLKNVAALVTLVKEKL